MIDIAGQTVAVIGAGRSGVAVAWSVATHGGSPVLLDEGPKPHVPPAGDAYPVIWSATPGDLPEDATLSVVSPGVRPASPLLGALAARQVPIWGEIEWAYQVARAPIVAVTGTNGKTTVTILLAAIAVAAGMRSVAAGNVSADDLKLTLTEAADTPDLDVIIAEVSSFQLERTVAFQPRVAVLTNITQDHLDRYPDVDSYAAAKARIFRSQSTGDLAVLNADDPLVSCIGSRLAGPRVAWFSLAGRQPGPAAAWTESGQILIRPTVTEKARPLMRLNELPAALPGAHSVANVMAAALAATELGIGADAIASAVRGFAGVPHRMELVAVVGGVRYVNNSMCTNPAAAAASIAAVDGPVLLIAGGVAKRLDMAALVAAVRDRVKRSLLIGESAEAMAQQIRAATTQPVTIADSLERAVVQAASEAKPGDTVLLAPACASFDMFRDFEDRGETFRRAVKALQKDGGR